MDPDQSEGPLEGFPLKTTDETPVQGTASVGSQDRTVATAGEGTPF